MTLFELSTDAISKLERADFANLGLLERGDLQRLLRDHVSVISPHTLVISEEFSSWDSSDRRVDLLGVDRQGRLVVIELKRTTDDKLIDLQALRYAAMISRMTFEDAVETYARYSHQRGADIDARAALLKFLGWSDPSEGRFAENVRIVLAAADFNIEVTSTVLWLNERELDITCVRLQPYRLGGSILLDVQQIIPLPETAPLQVQIRQKQREVRTAAEQSSDWTRYDVRTGTEVHESLYKRGVIYAAVRYLLDQSVTPEEIERVTNRKMFVSVEGASEGEAFRAEMARRRPNDPDYVKRYFSRDDQLFSAGGRTYAVSNQWSKTTLETVMDRLTHAYGSLGLSYNVAADRSEQS